MKKSLPHDSLMSTLARRVGRAAGVIVKKTTTLGSAAAHLTPGFGSDDVPEVKKRSAKRPASSTKKKRSSIPPGRKSATKTRTPALSPSAKKNKKKTKAT